MASWKKVITSGSDANLKSLVVSQSVNALSFTGSLQGKALSAEAVVVISATAPTSSLSGSLWYNTDQGNVYVQLNSPTGSTWVASTSNVLQSETASYALTAGYATTAQTASIATSRKPTGVVWNAFLNSPTSYGGSLLGNAAFDTTDNGVKLTTTSTGQTGNILWNLTGSNAFDFTQDFRGTFATYYGATAGNYTSGDGFIFNFGGSQTTVQTQGPSDNSLSVRVETYQDSSGSYLYTNGTQVGYNKTFTMGVSAISNAWNTWIVEVRTVPLLGKRFATLYWGSSLWPQVTADVTSWTPGGKVFVVGAWTGGATANQWCKSAVLEYI